MEYIHASNDVHVDCYLSLNLRDRFSSQHKPPSRDVPKMSHMPTRHMETTIPAVVIKSVHRRVLKKVNSVIAGAIVKCWSNR